MCPERGVYRPGGSGSTVSLRSEVPFPTEPRSARKLVPNNPARKQFCAGIHRFSQVSPGKNKSQRIERNIARTDDKERDEIEPFAGWAFR